MALPPLSVAVQIPRDRYYALRDRAALLGRSMQSILQEWIAPELAKLPPGRGPCSGLEWTDSDEAHD